MPQLDQFTYLTQFVWLCVFYMSFYVLLYNEGLPKISRILKLRKQLVLPSPKRDAEQSIYSLELFLVIFKECFNTSVSYLYSSISGASKWCNFMTKRLNAKKWSRLNKSYVRSLGEISISPVIKKNTLSTMGPSYYQSAYLAGSKTTAPNKIYVLRGRRAQKKK